MSRYSDYLTRKQAEYPDGPHKFDDACLATQFISAYNNGESFRVCVDFGYGDKPVWGYIGVTTGWKPCFLLMRRRGQHGSSDTLSANHRIVKTKWLEHA